MNNKTQFEIIVLSIKDLLSKPMLKIAFLPFIATVFIMYFMFFSVADIGLDALQEATVQVQTQETSMQNGITNTTDTTQTYTGYWILDFLLKYSITSWIVGFLVYTVGSFVILWLSLFVAIIIVGFLTPSILKNLQKKYYQDVQFDGYGDIANSAFALIKYLLIMLLLFIVLSPLYFIPLINIIAVNIPFYYFFHKMLHFDVGSTLMSKEDHQIFKIKNSFSIKLQTLFLYFLSLIPFVALILPVFYIIYLGHNYMSKIEVKNIKTLI